MKITVMNLKPRNPLARLARLRRAGNHQAGGRSVRQQAHRDLKRELDQLRPSP